MSTVLTVTGTYPRAPGESGLWGNSHHFAWLEPPGTLSGVNRGAYVQFTALSRHVSQAEPHSLFPVKQSDSGDDARRYGGLADNF